MSAERRPAAREAAPETNPIVLLLAEIAMALAVREREARAKLTVVRDRDQ